MRQMRADATLELQQEQRAELEKVARSRRTPQAVAQRARIVLMTAEGISPGVIGEQFGVSQPTVRKWRARYVEDGLPGLRNEPRPGRPRTLDDQRVADLLNKALQTRPVKQTHWSVRSYLVARLDMAPSAMTRQLKRLRGLGLIKKVTHTYRYYLTRLGRAAIAAACSLTRFNIVPAMAAAH